MCLFISLCSFEILGEFFNDLHTSIRLLWLRGLKPSFSNIYSQIECLMDRYFLLLGCWENERLLCKLIVFISIFCINWTTVILTWQILFLMLPVPWFELIEWRMTEKYCPITAENELSIGSIIHGGNLTVEHFMNDSPSAKIENLKYRCRSSTNQIQSIKPEI